ncbi:MAG: Zn-ribbon domain-containing OB-fold protein [Candidatus Binatia bacterium]
MEEVLLNRHGKLYTYCIVRQAPPGLKVPYAMGITELPEGVRVTSLIVTEHPEELKVGMEMELVIEGFRQDEEGREVLAYKFRPEIMRSVRRFSYRVEEDLGYERSLCDRSGGS